MKKVIFGLFVFSLLFASSCKKSNSTPNSWTFKGNQYGASLATFAIPGDFSATCSSTNQTINGGFIDINFGSGANPTTGGNYSVVSNAYTTNQVSIQLTTGNSTGSTTYNSTGSNNSQLAVSISGGKVSVTGSGIMLTNGTDSATVSINITQTQ